MPLSVRKSIYLEPTALALGLAMLMSFSGAQAQGPGGQTKQQPASSAKQPAVEVKKLDDNNKEVLRPIPAVLKTKSESAPPAKPLEKQKTAAAGSPSTPAGDKTAKSTPAEKSGAKLPEKAEAKSPEKSGLKSPEKADAKSPENANAKSSEKGSEKGLEKDADKKAASVEKKGRGRSNAQARGTHFVPPPPPTTPTMLGDSSAYGIFGGMPIEMLSKDALKDRVKEISIQYKDACHELEDHTRQKDEKIQRAAEFEGLFKEGVVSRRELEASQKEASEVNSDIDRLSTKVKELKGLLDRINKRLAPTVVKKTGHKLIN